MLDAGRPPPASGSGLLVVDRRFEIHRD